MPGPPSRSGPASSPDTTGESLHAEQAAPKGSEPSRSGPATWLRLAAELVALVLVAGVIAIGVKAFVAQAFFIPSASMEPQLRAGDRVIVSRISYRLHEPRRGDIVVFDDPLALPPIDDSFFVVRWGRDALEGVGLVRPDDKKLIKRVIGLPGETIEGRAGTVFIDGRPLIEPYLDDGVRTPDFDAYTVGEDEVFVLGDNRPNSQDSKRFDGVPIDTIDGRALARVWPPGRMAYL